MDQPLTDLETLESLAGVAYAHEGCSYCAELVAEYERIADLRHDGYPAWDPEFVLDQARAWPCPYMKHFFGESVLLDPEDDDDK